MGEGFALYVFKKSSKMAREREIKIIDSETWRGRKLLEL